jgi:hypothetical protein
MRVRLLLTSIVLVALLAVPRPARASASLGLGADWIAGGTNDFSLTLAADSFVARHLSLGGRAGAAFFHDFRHAGIPIDFRLTIHVQRIYFEGLVGPWLLFDGNDRLHFHGAFGFGLEAGALAVGLEVGKLSEATMLGLRLTFRL